VHAPEAGNGQSELKLSDATPDRGAAEDPQSVSDRNKGWRRWMPSSFVWYATALLFIASFVIEPGSVDSNSLNAMLPFAGILAIAAVGQTLVVMQRGIDLSLPGMMTVSALLVSKFASEHGNNIVLAIVVVAAVATVVGLVNGFAISFFTVTPLVATLAMNAILVGFALAYSGGTPVRAPEGVSNFSLDKTLGISNTDLLALLLVIVVAAVVARTIWGRRFVAVGASERAARTAGVPTERFKLLAYVAAALCYSAAGILLAGYVSTPNVGSGDQYLLPAIAAVVVGGTAFTGGRGNIVGTAVAAVFLSQLTQLVLSLGAPTATQLVIQAVVIALAAAAQSVDRGQLLAMLPTRASKAPATA
jgi:ribose transport system permease protein